jgi:hypothetical protein
MVRKYAATGVGKVQSHLPYMSSRQRSLTRILDYRTNAPHRERTTNQTSFIVNYIPVYLNATFRLVRSKRKANTQLVKSANYSPLRSHYMPLENIKQAYF